MTDLFRILVVIFLAMHGIGHVIWFLAAWTPLRSGFGQERWVLPGDVTIRSPLGKLWGIVALVVMLLFVAAAVALLAGSLELARDGQQRRHPVLRRRGALGPPGARLDGHQRHHRRPRPDDPHRPAPLGGHGQRR